MLRDVLILGSMFAVVLILIRIILTMPLMASSEPFVNPDPTNTSTVCPANTNLYMYGGAPYCCSGIVNTSGARLADTCRPTSRRDEKLTFCTLGPGDHTVKNCLSLRSGLLTAEGASICPRTMPNYVKGTSQSHCCADPGNATMTACTSNQSCVPSSDPNYFKQPESCQFRKAKEAVQCPTGFGVFTASGQGSMSNITLLGCTDNGQNCYPDSTLKRLQELGYDVAGLPSCSRKSA